MRGDHRGAFIVLEGGDGAGKTTQARLLCSALRHVGYRVHSTAEPSRGAIGRLIRRELLHSKKVPPEVEALLFAADRFLHLKSEVRPALGAGKVVVCDRYKYASFAYQGAQGLDTRWLSEVNRFAEEPHLGLYLDVPPKTGLQRIKRKRSLLEKTDLQRRVREEYLRFVEVGALVLIDSTQPVKQVHENILALVTRRLVDLGLHPSFHQEQPRSSAD